MRLGFIGVGNMGGAILRGICANGSVSAKDITIFDINSNLVHQIQSELGVKASSSNLVLAEESDLIILAVKPFLLGGVLEEIKPILPGKKVLSIAAGWTFKMLQDAVGSDVQVLRVMPNTPAMVGEGLTAFCAETTFDDEAFAYAKSLFEAVGKVSIVPERLFDGVIAVSGSSPAYIFMLIEAMGDATVREGIPRKDAYQMAAQAVYGSAKMVLESGKHPGELKDMVCSPAGTTIEAVATLERCGFRAAIMDAMGDCAEKSRQLSH